MKSQKSHIALNQQNTKDIDVYYFEGANRSQMAFWTCYADRVSKEHMHDFYEYMVCVSGQYTVTMNNADYILNAGDELFIPKGTLQGGSCIAGTITIHAFGGKGYKKSRINLPCFSVYIYI